MVHVEEHVEEEEDEDDQVGVVPDDVQSFLDFDWSNERWQKYLQGLYPPPNDRQTLRFKKKWYKQNIDPNLNDTHPLLQPPPEPPRVTFAAPPAATVNEPAAPDEANLPSGGGDGEDGDGDEGGEAEEDDGDESAPKKPSAKVPNPFVTMAAANDGSHWLKMGPKIPICFGAYALAMILAIAAIVDVLPGYQALVMLIAAFTLEILAKYGIKFKAEWGHAILLDDVGVMPLMIITLLAPRMHPVIRSLAVAVPFLTALLTLAQIAKAHPRLPPVVKEFFAPLTETTARFQVMDVRAKLEVLLGMALVAGVLTMRAAPFSALLFWNFMMMRYMMNPWTQEAFRKLDGIISEQVQPVYPLRKGYRSLKKFLYSLVDPNQKKKGGASICSIL